MTLPLSLLSLIIPVVVAASTGGTGGGTSGGSSGGGGDKAMPSPLDILDMVAENAKFDNGACFGTKCFQDMAVKTIEQASPVVLILGTIMIVIAGVKLLAKSSEDEISNARKSVLTVAFGIALTVLAANGTLLKGALGVEGGEGATILCNEFLGIVAIFEGIAGFLGVIAIAATGIKVLLSFGSEEAGGAMKNAVGAFVMGAFILIAKTTVFPAIGVNTGSCSLTGGASSVGLVMAAMRIIAILLNYLKLGAILIIVALCVMMLVYVGNEEKLSQLKSYLIRAAIGFVVLAMTQVIINVVILNS